MGDRTGSGLVELAILETLHTATGARPRAHVVSTKAVAGIEERIGLGPRYGYDVLMDLARPWIVPVPTVSVMGNRVTGTFRRPPGRSTPNAARRTWASLCSAVRDQIAAIDGITTEATWRFPAPLASMLRSWADRYRGEDIAASLAALEEAISRDRRGERHS